MRTLTNSLFVAFCFLLPAVSSGQAELSTEQTGLSVARAGLSAGEPSGDIKISYLGIEKGLSNNSVTSIYQDQRGFMWIGTFDGLNRYNGYDFLVFRNQPDDSTTLINNRIVSIYGNKDRIWIGTKKGVSVYDYLSGKFSGRYSIDPVSGARKLMEWPVNEVSGYGEKIYIATAGDGLLYQVGETDECRKIPLYLHGKLIWDFHAQGMAFDGEGSMWAFIQGYGIAVMKPGTDALQLISSIVRSGHSLVFDDDSNLWVGLDNGLLKYHIKDKRYEIFSHQKVRYKVTDLLFLEGSKQLWAATDGNGIVQYDIDEQAFTPFNSGINNKSLTSNSVYALYLDHAERKWVGTLRGGVNIVESESLLFRTVSRNEYAENPLASDFILSFCELNDENVWIGTDGKGVSRWDRRRNTFTSYSHDPHDPYSLPNDFVTAIVKAEGGYWFGTYGGGISRFNEVTKRFQKYTLFDDKDGYERKNVWVIFKDLNDQMWVTTLDGDGLFKYDREKDRFDFVDAGISGILSLAQDSLGNFWAGTFDELVKIDLDGGDNQIMKTEYPVRAILPEDNGMLLIGTEGGGLWEFEPVSRQKTVFTQADGLSNNSVLNILRDDAGMYWLSTFNGISKFNRHTGNFVNYYDSDGLQSNQFNYNAALKLSDGELLMGGIKGFNIIDPGINDPADKFPRLLVSGIRINNVPLEQTGRTAFGISELELPYNQSMLTINFVALEYTMPDKISYAYFLEGWDIGWHYAGDARVANYSKLAAGSYVLKIRSTNADGTWNEEVTSLPVTIRPPWYNTGWAWFLYLMLGSGLAYVVVTYQKRQTRLKYEIRLSKDRIRQEKELNEKKLTFFTNISHEFRSPLTMIINPLKEMVYGKDQDPGAIEVAYRNSRRLLSLVDQLLFFRKTETETGEMKVVRLDAVTLCKEVYSCFLHHARSRNIDYELQTNTDQFFIYADRQKIEIALFNLISNALKFSPEKGGKVVVHVTGKTGTLDISVSDKGIGIPENEKKRIFDLFYQSARGVRLNKKGFGVGLYLVKKFIEQHSGEVNFTSDARGTTFEITLKRGRDHFGDVLIHEDFEEHVVFYEELENAGEPEEDALAGEPEKSGGAVIQDIVENSKTVLIIDDNPQIRRYIKRILSKTYRITEAGSAEQGLEVIRQRHPDLIISDVVMGEMNGVELCKIIKNDDELKHIPLILLTASGSEEIKLTGVEVGADDYITKPFDKDYLTARIKGILKRQETIHDHLLNTVTQRPSAGKMSQEDKEFFDQMVTIIEANLEDDDFNIRRLAGEMGMSHSLMYKRIKAITGKSLNELVRFIRLRKAATLLITSDSRVNEAASITGFNDLKYFRKQFQQQYGMSPSEFQKKYRNALQDKQFVLNESFWGGG